MSGLPLIERSRFLIHEASGPQRRCWVGNERCGMENLWPQFRGKLISRFVPPPTCQAGVAMKEVLEIASNKASLFIQSLRGFI